jgi:predicted ATPase/DNA-binding CsgD family transcriptional regulator/Tfp pilus assembly protein PilF
VLGTATHVQPDRRSSAALPAQPGPLIGRAQELELLCARLGQAEVRLLTLTGPAGTGKTRLAIELASRVSDQFDEAVFFVDLAPVSDAAMVPAAIARALGIREERDRPVLQVIVEHLATRRCLLVLDNFEQVLSAASDLSELLQASAEVTLVVTSRQALRLRWEHAFPVPPLVTSAAVELFVHRAQRADPHFALTQTNAGLVEAVCVRLDGLPLAIELAAARSRVLPPRALLSRLGQRLDVLAAPGPDQPPRQRTLRAALDWSYELLSAPEQVVFRRLGVFVGGFPLGAVGEVCDPDDALHIDPVGVVESLLDKSLIRQEPAQAHAADSEPRFGLLETVREYALERLRDAGERDIVRGWHANYYLLGADAPVAEMKMAQQSMWLRSLEAEYDNLQAALGWCAQARQPELGLSAAGLLSWFWTVRGHVAAGRRSLSDLLELASDAPATLRAHALVALGSLALHQSDYAAARALFEESLAVWRELGEPGGSIGALANLGAVYLQQGDLDKAERSFEDALAIQRRIGDRLGIIESLNSLANVAHERGDLAGAREFYERTLVEQHNSIRYRPDVVLHNLGVVDQEQGDLSSAQRHFEDSVALRRAIGDTAGLALSLAKLGEVASSMGEPETAHRLLCESLTLQRDLGDRHGMAFVLERFGMAAAARGKPRQALKMAAAADALREVIGVPLAPRARLDLDHWVAAARNALTAEDASAAWTAGRKLSLDQALAVAVEFEPTPAPAQSVVGTGGITLSAREREVAALVAEGLSNRDIAERLVVSSRTAENHVQHVLNRLGLRSRSQVAAWAIRNGLVAEENA